MALMMHALLATALKAMLAARVTQHQVAVPKVTVLLYCYAPQVLASVENYVNKTSITIKPIASYQPFSSR
jgi:hypothetical protein